MRDSRVTDSVLGGWSTTPAAGSPASWPSALSTGRSEATTRCCCSWSWSGFSRLGSNPLKVLKDNIPGYRLLRERAQRVRPWPFRLIHPTPRLITLRSASARPALAATKAAALAALSATPQRRRGQGAQPRRRLHRRGGQQELGHRR
jgi:hypothetical protein